ncbi:DUF4309 domain-containing protein [Brevibacillus laterosporus]|uniref:DUF4309 domain-containing protein n=1 Tax=Brevibacillus laterosporus TaxID=1465 RepID=UPI00264D53F6|nr:DUF4309 domain-containing protein [Brevibacillus laterosporus]MDN9009042.1 DUF4309 domain-containing protein [Brevibacillus laterosporus]MDO0942495.1 DUF4309 domain-containing protein [Brevibacillus laterosporus]
MRVVHILAIFTSVSLLLVGCSTSKQADKEINIQISEAKQEVAAERESISKTEVGNSTDSGAKSKAATDKSADKSTEPLDLTKSKLLLDIKEQAEKGKLKGITTSIGTAYNEIEKVYGKPKITNVECWTYSYDHPKTTANFFFDHDSCGEELNQVKPTTKLNRITVEPTYYNVQLTEHDIRQGLGEPTNAYDNEAYDGYEMYYNVGKYQIFIRVDTDSSDRKVSSISVRTPLVFEK